MEGFTPTKRGNSWVIAPNGEGWVFDRTYPTKWKASLALNVWLRGGSVSDYFSAAREEKSERQTWAEPKPLAPSAVAVEPPSSISGKGPAAAVAVVVGGSGFLSLAFLGVMLAVWIWGWIDALLDAPLLVTAALTLPAWLAATTVLSAVQAALIAIMGAFLGALVAGVGGGYLAWALTGLMWQAVVAGYGLGMTTAFVATRRR